MSITGVSAVSSAAYNQQWQTPAKPGAGAQTTFEEAAAAPLGAAAKQSASGAGSGEVRNHHHHHTGGAASRPADLTQSGAGSTGGTNLINTLA